MRKRTLIPLILLILIIGGIWYLGDFNNQSIEEEPNDEVDTSSWATFSSDQYNFEIDYPVEDWNVATAPDHPAGPQFNFYVKPAGVPVDTPFIHFSNITNVSVFPEGIGTEGLMGQTRELEGDWGDNVSYEDSQVYTLESGEPFAAYISFENVPDSWQDWGYGWARIYVDDFESVCFQDGVEMDPNECDPLGDESVTIRYRGEVDEDIWPSLRTSIKSINFN